VPSLLLALPPEELPPSMPGMEPQAESRSRILAIREKTILFLIITTPQFTYVVAGGGYCAHYTRGREGTQA
jgi:hypothetical protein